LFKKYLTKDQGIMLRPAGSHPGATAQQPGASSNAAEITEMMR